MLVSLEQNILGAEGNKVGVHVRSKNVPMVLFLAIRFFGSNRKEMTYWIHWGFRPDLIPNGLIIPLG